MNGLLQKAHKSEITTSKKSLSCELFDEALRWIPGGVNSPVRAFRAVGGQPFFVTRAAGPFLYTIEGIQLIDYVCGWGPHILGHADKRIVDALQNTAHSGTSFGVNQPGEIELARRIARAIPGAQKVRLCNSGTEACATAIRLARGFTGRDLIVKFSGCFHGHVDALLVAGGSGQLTLGQPESAGIPSAVAALTRVLPFNDIQAARSLFQKEGKHIAGVILEPIPANAGLYLPLPGFLETLRELCTEYESILIFDEVMTGFRVAPGGAAQLFGITPDLTTLGKVIGGGLPVGAVCGLSEIMDFLAPLGPVYHAGTLAGNPLVTAAGCAQIDALDAEDAWCRLNDYGKILSDGLRDTARAAGIPVQVSQLGSMLCIYFTSQPVRNLDDAKKSDTALFSRFFHSLLQQHIYIPPSQFECWFLSLSHGTQIIEDTLQAAKQALLTCS